MPSFTTHHTQHHMYTQPTHHQHHTQHHKYTHNPHTTHATCTHTQNTTHHTHTTPHTSQPTVILREFQRELHCQLMKTSRVKWLQGGAQFKKPHFKKHLGSRWPQITILLSPWFNYCTTTISRCVSVGFLTMPPNQARSNIHVYWVLGAVEWVRVLGTQQVRL